MRILILTFLGMCGVNAKADSSIFTDYVGARGVLSGSCNDAWNTESKEAVPLSVVVSEKQFSRLYVAGKTVDYKLEEFSDIDDGAGMEASFSQEGDAAVFSESHWVGTTQSRFLIKLSHSDKNIQLHLENMATSRFRDNYSKTCDLVLE